MNKIGDDKNNVSSAEIKLASVTSLAGKLDGPLML